jgi:hypothetical protein
MTYVTPHETERTALLVVPSAVQFLDDFASVALALVALASLMVIVALVSTYSEAHARRLSTRRYHGERPVDETDPVALLTILLLVVVIVVAAKIIGVPI